MRSLAEAADLPWEPVTLTEGSKDPIKRRGLSFVSCLAARMGTGIT
ncbi:hypothetical protein [Mediterraneibacter gnavus]